MADSMIPYSFIPGTKAKATEVNANFLALVKGLEQNKLNNQKDIENLTTKFNNELNLKANKTELVKDFTVTDAETDLDNYKTTGTYVFSNLYTPLKIPKGDSGILIVSGKEDSTLKQIWFCNDKNPEIFTRDFTNSAWGNWKQTLGETKLGNPGYLKLPNGLIIQWGLLVTTKSLTYPIAYKVTACPIVTKFGWQPGATKSDTGFHRQYLTGFEFGTAGDFWSMNWFVIGY